MSGGGIGEAVLDAIEAAAEAAAAATVELDADRVATSKSLE